MKKQMIRHFQKVSKIEGIAIVILCILVISGWLFNMERLTRAIPQSSQMNPITAIACILAVVSLFCLSREHKFFLWISRVLSFIVLTVGFTRLVNYWTGLPVDITPGLFSLIVNDNNQISNATRIAPNTAFGVFLVGLALLTYHVRFGKKFYPADFLSLLTSLISFTGLIGYLYEGNGLYTIKGQIAMSLPGAIILFLLSTSILFSRSSVGVLRVVTGEHPGSRMIRQLVPFALLLPVATGLFRTYNQAYNVLPESIITAAIIMVNIVVMVGLIWSAAGSMNSSAICLAHEKHETEMLRERLRDEENKQLKNRLMEAKVIQQKAVLVATIEGQEKEKKQLGMELHDHINQILASTKLYLELANTEKDPVICRQLVKKSTEQVNSVINEIRQLSHSLVMHHTGKESILEDIARLVNKINEMGILTVHPNISGEVIEKLDRQGQIGIYRILQEQLQNVVKHSGASQVELYIWEEQDEVHIWIKDNGKGFDPLNKPKGIGLRNIESRVVAMEGKINIISGIDRGCELRITIPLVSASAGQLTYLNHINGNA